MLSLTGVAPVCDEDPLELTCTTTGSYLEWRFNVIHGNATTATEFSRIMPVTGSASDAVSVTLLKMGCTVTPLLGCTCTP